MSSDGAPMSTGNCTPGSSECSTPRLNPHRKSTGVSEPTDFQLVSRPNPSSMAHFITPSVPKKSDFWYEYVCFQIPEKPIRNAATGHIEMGYDIEDWYDYSKISATCLSTRSEMDIRKVGDQFKVKDANGYEIVDYVTVLTSLMPDGARKLWNEYADEMKRRLGLRVLMIRGLWPENSGKFTVELLTCDD